MMAPVAASLIALMASSLIKPVASVLINVLSGKGVMRVAKRQEERFTPLLALQEHFKESQEQEKDIIIWIIWTKIFSSAQYFKQY